MSTEFDEGSEILDRRQAIKKAAVGAAAAGVVWSAPKIEGLSLRPNYAAANSSGAPITITFSGTVNSVNEGLKKVDAALGGGKVTMSIGNANLNSSSITLFGVAYAGVGTVTLNAIAANPGGGVSPSPVLPAGVPYNQQHDALLSQSLGVTPGVWSLTVTCV